MNWMPQFTDDQVMFSQGVAQFNGSVWRPPSQTLNASFNDNSLVVIVKMDSKNASSDNLVFRIRMNLEFTPILADQWLGDPKRVLADASAV